MKKRVLAMMLLMVMTMGVLAACSGSAGGTSPAVGTWKGIWGKYVGDTERITDEEFTLVLETGGKGTHYRDDLEISVTWKLDGENFTMTETFLGTIDYTGTLSGNELHIFNGDPDNDFTYEYAYEKQ